MRERGFALPTVLWACVLIAVTISGLLTLQRSLHHRAHDALLAAQLRETDDAAIYAAMHDLNGIRRKIVRYLDGRPMDWTFQGREVVLRVQDELGKVDLNFADGILLRRLFIAAGGDPAAGDVFADRIADWRERGVGRRLHGAKRDDYAAAGLTYGPREAPFMTVGELHLVLGMTDEIFDRVSPGLTVYSESPSIDESVAPPLVLMCTLNLNVEDTRALLAQRNRGGASTLSSSQTILGHAFTISAETTDGPMEVRRTAIVRITGRGLDPEWTYSWE